MVVKPEDLWVQDRPEIQSAVMRIEKAIDDHLYQYYTKKGDDVPLLQIDEPLPIVKEIIITKYGDAGWDLRIGRELELGQISIFFSEKPDPIPVEPGPVEPEDLEDPENPIDPEDPIDPVDPENPEPTEPENP